VSGWEEPLCCCLFVPPPPATGCHVKLIHCFLFHCFQRLPKSGQHERYLWRHTGGGIVEGKRGMDELIGEAQKDAGKFAVVKMIDAYGSSEVAASSFYCNAIFMSLSDLTSLQTRRSRDMRMWTTWRNSDEFRSVIGLGNILGSSGAETTVAHPLWSCDYPLTNGFPPRITYTRTASTLNAYLIKMRPCTKQGSVLRMRLLLFIARLRIISISSLATLAQRLVPNLREATKPLRATRSSVNML